MKHAWLLALLVACGDAGMDVDSPPGGAAGSAAPAVAPDVGVTTSALTDYQLINSNGGALLSGENSRKKGALRGYVMQWWDPGAGFTCLFNCPSGEDCVGQSGGCLGMTVHLTNCHTDSKPYQAKQICNVIQNGSYWGFMRYCADKGSSICDTALFSFVDQNNDAHQEAGIYIRGNHMETYP